MNQNQNKNEERSASEFKPRILLCVPKKERAHAWQSILGPCVRSVDIAMTLYEATQTMKQHLCHVIVFESLTDAHVSDLKVKMSQIPNIKAPPILIPLISSSKESPETIRSQGFIPFHVGNPSAIEFGKILREIFSTYGGNSPYQYLFTEYQQRQTKLKIGCEATVVGRWKDAIVVHAPFELRAHRLNELQFRSQQDDKSRAEWHAWASTTVPHRTGWFHLIPYRCVDGSGRSWLVNESDLSERIETTEKNIIPSHDHDAPSVIIYASEKTLSEKNFAKDIGILIKSVANNLGVKWLTNFDAKVDLNFEEHQLGDFLSLVKLRRWPEHLKTIELNTLRSSNSVGSGELISEANIRAVDESGVVIELRAPCLVGAKIRLIDPGILNGMIEDHWSLVATAVRASLEGQSFLVRFEWSSATLGPSKAYELLLKLIPTFPESRKSV